MDIVTTEYASNWPVLFQQIVKILKVQWLDLQYDMFKDKRTRNKEFVRILC